METGDWDRCRCATDIAGQRAVLPAGGIRNERVIVPEPGGGCRFRRSGTAGLTSLIFFPKPINRRAQSGLHLGLVDRFWTILGGILACFIVLKQLVQGFDSWHSVQAELLEVPSQRIHEPALVTIELRESAWILSHLLVVVYNTFDSSIENHQPSGIAGNDLCEYPCGSDIRSAVHSQFDVRSPYVNQPPLLVFSVLLKHLVRPR
jgi:hypothetical protein